MKGIMRKGVAVVTAVMLFAGLIYSDAAAAAKPSLNRKRVTLSVGKKITLKVKNNKKKVKWSSSREKVASVTSRGVVRARKKGTAKITAKVGKTKYTCRVTVVKKTATTSRTQASDYARQVLTLVNKERAAEGLAPLTLDKSLCDVAGARAKEITSLFSHTRPDGSKCFTILDQKNITYHAAGENIAAGQKTPKEVVAGWMNSPGHRENIMSDNFHKLGVGYVTANDIYGHYWVQIFSD